jgi:hypothetical protein
MTMDEAMAEKLRQWREKKQIVIFRYIGGPKDGTECRSDVPSEGMPAEALANWLATKQGQIGEKLATFSESDVRRLTQDFASEWRQHYYEVTDREETKDTLIITCKYFDTEHKSWPKESK